MTKVYLVIGRNECGEDLIFGVFSTIKKAMEIQYEMRANFEARDEECDIEILKVFVDKPTDDYDFLKHD